MPSLLNDRLGIFAQDRAATCRRSRTIGRTVFAPSPRSAGRGPWMLRSVRRFLRRSPLRTFRPNLLPLEPLALLSSMPAAPTPEEQYILQLINRARANPAAEGQRLLAL